MSGPTKADFAEAIDEYWHDRPPASLEDVMALYGILAVAESGGEVFRTSSKLESYVDDGRIVTIHVDVGSNPPSYLDTKVDALRDDLVDQLGFAGRNRKQSGQGADYSVTQAGSNTGNEPDEIAEIYIKRIRWWCQQDTVRSVVGQDGHPDGWIVDQLGAVFEKDSDTLQAIHDDVVSLLTGSEPTVITVAVHADANEIDAIEGDKSQPFYPGELSVLEEAMHRYRTQNQADKNLPSSRISEGNSTGLVTGSEDRVVGTPESPLGLFSVKHPDAQPALRRDDSWQNYPVGERTALLFDNGSDLIERCVFRKSSMETYALPYFSGELTPGKAETLYNSILSLDPDENEDQPPMARVTYNLEESEDERLQEWAEELRYHYLTLPISDDTHVIAEISAASTYWVNQVANGLVSTFAGPTGTEVMGGFPKSENWPLLDFPDDTDRARRNAYYSIVNHEFTNATFAYRDEVDDDFRRSVDQQLIEGRSIEASVLFEEYMARFGDAFEGDAVPWQIPAMQFVQFEALSRAGLLAGFDSGVAPTVDTMTQHQSALTNVDEIRETRIESFLDRPMFADDLDPSENQIEGTEAEIERTAAFLGGVLIGQVSWYQEHERSVGQPLDTRTQADKLTSHAFEQSIRTALEKAKVYASESQYESDVLYPEVVDRLLASLERQPTEWNVDKHEMQFMISLGQSFGRRAMPSAYDVREENSDETDAATQEGEA